MCLRDKEILNIIYGRGKVGDDCKVCECVLDEGNIVKEREDIGSNLLLKNEYLKREALT